MPRTQLYEEALRLRSEKGFGSLRISRLIEVPKSTVDSWIYHRPKRARNLWTQEEDDILKKYYGIMDKEKLLKLFMGTRNWMAIRTRASVLGLKRLMGSKQAGHTPLIDGKVSDFDIGFIIGLIEGEGTITCYTPRPPKIIHPCPAISISNSSLQLLEHAQRIIGGKIHFHGSPGRPVGGGTRYVSKKNMFKLTVYGLTTVFKTLKILQPYFITKRKVCDLIIELCEERFKQPYHAPLSDKEKQIVEEVRRLNG
jgi:hypothetical protein